MEDKTQSEPATKGDLINGLTSLKTELKGDISALAGTVAHVAIELSKTQEDVSRIMNAIDAFAAEAVAYRNHDVLRGGKIMEHESKLNNHEDRLAVLEKPK